jgi:DnaJ-class molecular chaperone
MSSSAVKEDYYALLGVLKGASKEDVKKAYYKKAKQFHPDTNTADPAANKKFSELTLAYDVLLDDEKRKAYDAFGHAGLDDSGGSGDMGSFYGGGRASTVDMFNFFEDAFGARVNLGRHHRPPHGRDVQVNVMLDLQEAVNGCTKTIMWRSALAGKQTLEVRVCYRLLTPRLHGAPPRIQQ